MGNVSVIIPTKNRESLLRVTLNNILSQTLVPHEIIVVDDGSTDHTEQMIKNEFSSSVKYVANQGSGPGAARNTGLSISKGEFIQFFDSDDLMTHNKIEVQQEILQSNTTVDFVYGPYVKANEDSGGWNQLDVIMQFFPVPRKPFNEVVAQGWCAITQSCLFRRSLIDRVGSWREDLMPHEDKEYWYRIAKLARGSFHEHQTCVFYRQHQMQITDQHVDDVKRTIDGIKAFDLIINRLKEDRVSLLSSVICRGIRAGYVRSLNARGNFEYRNNLVSTLEYSLYRVYQKIGRVITKTNWQPLHGVLDSPTKFSEYKSLLK